MPFKDPEQEKEYRREQKRKQRAARKAGQGEADSLAGTFPPFEPEPENPPPPAPEPPAPEMPIGGKKRRPEGRASRETSPMPEATPVPESIPISEAISEPISETDSEPELHIIDDPREVADESRRRLDRQGWVVWNCTILGGEPIVIIRDQYVTGYPEDIPSYTEDELKMIIELSNDRIRYIHNLKKINPGSRYLATLTKI